MKNILSLTAAIVISLTSLQAQNDEAKLAMNTSAQTQERKLQLNRAYLYGTLGPAVGNAFTSSWGISTIINKKWIAGYGSLKSSRPTELPQGFQYDTSTDWLLFLIFPLLPFLDDGSLENKLQFRYLSFGRYFPVSRQISFIVDGGLGLANQQGYNFYRNGAPVKQGERILDGVSTNYTVTAVEKSSMGGIVRAGVDWAFVGFGGMGLDLYYNLNAGGIDDNFGVNLRFMLGYMPRYRKNAVRQ